MSLVLLTQAWALTATDLDRLLRERVELQGYHFAKPMPAAAFEGWLHDRHLLPERQRALPA